MSGFSQKYAAGVLGHTWAKTELAKPSKVYLALCITVPTNSSTGSTISEPSNSEAEGYARREVKASELAAAEEAATSKIKNSAELIFANITAGTGATIVGWALVDASSAGNVVMWGTATSTVISPTQTPPTVGTEKLVGELK